MVHLITGRRHHTAFGNSSENRSGKAHLASKFSVALNSPTTFAVRFTEAVRYISTTKSRACNKLMNKLAPSMINVSISAGLFLPDHIGHELINEQVSFCGAQEQVPRYIYDGEILRTPDGRDIPPLGTHRLSWDLHRAGRLYPLAQP